VQFACGVGQCAACSFSGLEFFSSVSSLASPLFQSRAEGVAHSRIASVSVVPACRPLSVEYPAAPEDFASVVVAVGQEEDAVAAVRRSHVGRSDTDPLHIEPEFGKRPQHVGEPKRNVSCDVLEESERCSAVLEDSRDVGPEVALVVLSESLACDAERLAGISACDEIH